MGLVQSRASTLAVQTPQKASTNDACFTCNQKGHWASKCPQKLKSTDVQLIEGLTDEVELEESGKEEP